MRTITTLFQSPWPYRVVRAGLAAAFILAGVSKLLDLHAFGQTIKAFAILPSGLVKPVALVLPVLEIVGGLLLVCDAPIGLAIIGGLLLVFIAVVANAIRQGLDIDCGCYGPGDPEGAVYHGLRPTLWRDLFMLSGVFYCLLWRGLRRSPAQPPNPSKEHPCALSN